MTTDIAGVDFAPLSDSVPWPEAKQMRRAGRNGAFGEATATAIREAKPMAIWLTVGFGGLITVIIGIVALVQWIQGDDAYVGGIVTAFVAVLCVLIYFLGTLVRKAGWRRTARLIKFAQANGFRVEPTAPKRTLPGVIFTIRVAHSETTELIQWQVRGHAAEAAHHLWHISGGNSTVREVRYLAVALNVSMPRLAFGAERHPTAPVDRDFGTDLLAGDARVSGRHRPQLICGPDGRDRARALFTDELIGLLTRAANAEVVDGYLFVYYEGEGKLDEDFWRHKFAVADVAARNADALAATADPG